MTTAKKTFFGTIWNVLLNIFNQASSLIVYVLLARILSVEEFGLIAFCFLITEMILLLGNFGVNQILIQKPTWNERLASNCFWFLIFVACVFALVLCFVIAPISDLFFYKGSAMMLVALSSVPIINSFSLVSQARLQRTFKNKLLTIINVLGTSIGGGTSIYLVYTGYGVWAVIWGRILQTILVTSMVIIMDKFVPKYPVRKKYWKVIINFGLPLFYNTCLNFLSNRSVNFAIAFLLGSTQFAFISVTQRAFRMLSEITVTPLNAVLLPAFSRVDKGTDLSTVYCRVISIASILVVPMYIGLATVSSEIVFLLFGPKWEISATLLTIMCFGIYTSLLAWFLPSLLISRAFTGQSLKLNLVAATSNIIFTTIGAYFSIEYAVYGLLISSVFSLPIRFWIVKKKIPISFSNVLKASFPAIISSLIMFAGVGLTFYYLKLDVPLIIELVLKISLGILVYVATLFIIFRKFSLRQVDEILTMLKR